MTDSARVEQGCRHRWPPRDQLAVSKALFQQKVEASSQRIESVQPGDGTVHAGDPIGLVSGIGLGMSMPVR